MNLSYLPTALRLVVGLMVTGCATSRPEPPPAKVSASAVATPRVQKVSLELVAWSADGGRALINMDEEDSDGSHALGYEVIVPGESLPPQVVLAGGPVEKRRRVGRGDCVDQAKVLGTLLVNFDDVSIHPDRCDHPATVVSIGPRATAAVKRSILAPRPSAGVWFEQRDHQLQIGTGEKVESTLLIMANHATTVALSPSHRLLLVSWCTEREVCGLDAWVSTTGAIAAMELNREGLQLLRTIADDRSWWDGTAKRSPVEASFDPAGDHPFSCVREDGTYWMVQADDTGVRVSRDGKISGRQRGEIDARGNLQMGEGPSPRLDYDGRLFCRDAKTPFARVDREGIVKRNSGETLGAITGDIDWRKNRRAAFLLLVDGCKLDQP